MLYTIYLQIVSILTNVDVNYWQTVGKISHIIELREMNISDDKLNTQTLQTISSRTTQAALQNNHVLYPSYSNLVRLPPGT